MTYAFLSAVSNAWILLVWACAPSLHCSLTCHASPSCLPPPASLAPVPSSLSLAVLRLLHLLASPGLWPFGAEPSMSWAGFAGFPFFPVEAGAVHQGVHDDLLAAATGKVLRRVHQVAVEREDA